MAVKSNILNQLVHSVFLRLVLIFLTAGILLLATLGPLIGHTFKQHLRTTFLDHVTHYSGYIINDIGLPPDTVRAREISKAGNMELAILGGNIRWYSYPPLADFSQLPFKDLGGSNIKIHHDRSFWVACILQNEYAYYFYHKKLKHHGFVAGYKALFFLSVFLVLLLCYLAVRYLFKPISWVKEGARRIGEGDLDYRLPEKRRDELGLLSTYINNMADEIKKMLEAKRHLLLAISHELRSPLTRARVSLEFVKDKKAGKDIKEDIGEMEELINSLLESEKLNTRHSKLDLKKIEVYDWLTGNLGELFPQNIGDIRVSAPERGMTAIMDPLRMRLLLKNLVENALRHTPEKSLPINISLSLKEGFLELMIADRGEGIASHHLEKITEPFYRADKSRARKTGGHGLGLYLCRLIAEAHGGKLHIESEPDTGTVVSVSIPLS